MISVVIPTRHRNTALAECLAKLAPAVQTLPADQFEVIVTDDGAETTAEAMIRDRFPWARWTAGPRRGPAANRNHGETFAGGDWLAFTDDDCLPSSNWLMAYFVAIDNRPGIQVLEGRTSCNAGIRSLMQEAPVNLTGGNLWSCNMMVSRDAFVRTGRFDERFRFTAEDMEFHGRLRNAGYSVAFVADATVDHPPRPRRLGVAAAQMWEGRVLLAEFEPATMPEMLPLHVAKLRATQMISAGLSVATILFGLSSLIEVVVVLASWRRWVNRYLGTKRLATSRLFANKKASA